MKKEKVDKGFELNYYNLSYRRRFIRTLWLIPWMILALHNYKKWKEEIDKK